MSKLSSLPLLATLVMTATLSACGSISPSGILAASRLDPLNTNPSEISVAVGVPDTLRLKDGDAVLRIAFQGGSATSTIRLEETAPLQVTLANSGTPRPTAEDEVVYVARIEAADASRIADLQRQIKDVRATGTQGEGSLTVRVVGGCFVGGRPDEIAVSTWLQTDPDDGFVQLTRRQDVVRAVGAQDGELLLSQLRPCGSGE